MNTMSTEKKKYELKARARTQEETRAKIVRAAVELHGAKGVAMTTVTEIARRAGVSRLTVYNHFPDLQSLLPACAAHYGEQHPFPDVTAALQHDDPETRVAETLRLLYGWYRETETMYSKVFADRITVPEVDEFISGDADRHLVELATALTPVVTNRRSRDKVPKSERQRLVMLRLALDFWTWRRLHQEGLDDAAAARLMAETVVRAG